MGGGQDFQRLNRGWGAGLSAPEPGVGGGQVVHRGVGGCEWVCVRRVWVCACMCCVLCACCVCVCEGGRGRGGGEGRTVGRGGVSRCGAVSWTESVCRGQGLGEHGGGGEGWAGVEGVVTSNDVVVGVHSYSQPARWRVW